MVEHDETVIDSVETELGTNITNSNSLQRTVIFQTTDLDTERMGSEILSVEDKTGHNDGMVGSLAETTDPPLTRGQGRGVNFKFVCLINVCSSSFQALDVGAMSKLQFRQSAELSDTKSFNNTKPIFQHTSV